MAIQTETGQSIVDHGLYWWHRAILQELDRIHAFGNITPALLADNMKYINRSLVMDSLRSIDQLIAAGMLTEDTAGHLTLTPAGADWAA